MSRIIRLIAISVIVLLAVTLSAKAAAPTSITEPDVDMRLDFDTYQTSMYAGYDYSYSFYYFHADTGGDEPAEDVVISISLPQNAIISYAEGEGTALGTHWDALPDTVGPVVNGSQLSWHLGTINESHEGWIEVHIRIPEGTAGETLTITTRITSTTTDINPSNNTLECQYVVQEPVVDLVANHTIYDTDALFAPGTVISHRTVMYPDHELLPTKGSVFTQTLSSGLTMYNYFACIHNNKASSSCSADITAMIEPIIDGQDIIWQLPDVTPPQAVSITSLTLIDPSLQGGDTITSTVTAMHQLSDPDLSNNSAYTVTQLLPPETVIDTWMNLYYTPPYEYPVLGDVYDFYVVGANLGTTPIEGAVLTLTLPDGLTNFVSEGSIYRAVPWYVLYDRTPYDEAAAPIVSGQSLTWNLPTLNGHQLARIYIRGLFDPALQDGDSLTFTSSITTTSNPALQANDTGAIVVSDPYVDISVEHGTNTSQYDAAPGGGMMFSFFVESIPEDNHYFSSGGNTTAYNTIVTATLPPGLTFDYAHTIASTMTADLRCEQVNDVLAPTFIDRHIVWTLPCLHLEKKAYFRVYASASESLSPGTVLNTIARVNPVERDVDVLNDASVKQIIISEPIGAVAGWVNGETGSPGATVQYIIYGVNNGNIDADSITVTQTVPSVLTFLDWEGTLYQASEVDLTQSISVTTQGEQLSWTIYDVGYAENFELYPRFNVDPGIVPGTFLSSTVEFVATYPGIASVSDYDEYFFRISRHEADLSIEPYARTYSQSETETAITSQATTSVRYVPTGSDLTYAITIDNPANSAMRNVIVTAPLPEGTTFASAECEGLDTPVQPTLDGNTLTWNLDTIPALNAITLYPTIHIPSSMESGLELSSDVILETVDPDWYYHNNYATTTVTTFNADSWLFLPIVSK